MIRHKYSYLYMYTYFCFIAFPVISLLLLCRQGNTVKLLSDDKIRKNELVVN